MQPESRNPYGTPIAVEGWVRYALQIERCEKAAQDARAIVRLRNVFRTISESAVADQEVETSLGKVIRMNAGDAADG